MWAAIGRQLRCPSGLGGFLTSYVMDVLNRRSNRLGIEALRPAANDTILDLGCGSGQAVQALATSCPTAQILGIDHSTAIIARAARRNRRAIQDGRVQLLFGDFSALPYREIPSIRSLQCMCSTSPMLQASAKHGGYCVRGEAWYL